MLKCNLTTERLYLKPVNDSDFEEVFLLFSNPNVTRWTKAKTHKSIEETEKLIAISLEKYDKPQLWTIRIKDLPQVIGMIHFYISPTGKAEIHYVLSEDFWNRGIMTEAVSSIVTWIKKHYSHLEKIYIEVVAENIGSCRVLEKCGFQQVNRRCVRWQKFYPHFIDLICYELKLNSFVVEN